MNVIISNNSNIPICEQIYEELGNEGFIETVRGKRSFARRCSG